LECLQNSFDFDVRELPGRIWSREGSTWQNEDGDDFQTTNRLGWLNAPSNISDSVGEYVAFADEIRDSGYTKVVLLGMGGSSLFGEVIRQCWGSAEGYPDLIVLDSTIPSTVTRLTEQLRYEKTLFLVSSKSGTTTEVIAFCRYFFGLISSTIGENAGQSFVAITDPGTPLADLAREYGFRKVFYADPDVGGRYSAFTTFGILPAALIGLDVKALTDHARQAEMACVNTFEIDENPGLSLGIKLGISYLNNRDKLTLICSPAIRSFGLWVEQLIAESTGKDCKGMLPVLDEPVGDVGKYSRDRVFVALSLTGDENAVIDRHTTELIKGGHDVIRLSIDDKYKLGSEVYRWMFATSVLGAVMRINPFDQPNVQESKDNTEKILAACRRGEEMPVLKSDESISTILSDMGDGQYLAIMAYVGYSNEMDAALQHLRAVIFDKHAILTTKGYGPRFLHSTGQLHKGGSAVGRFIQICEKGEELPIPGSPYGFSMLAEAQSIGDYQALRNRGFRIARIELNNHDDIVDAVYDIASAV